MNRLFLLAIFSFNIALAQNGNSPADLGSSPFLVNADDFRREYSFDGASNNKGTYILWKESASSMEETLKNLKAETAILSEEKIKVDGEDAVLLKEKKDQGFNLILITSAKNKTYQINAHSKLDSQESVARKALISVTVKR